MVFKKTWDSGNEITYTNPAFVHSYSVRKYAEDRHDIRLHMPYGYATLANPETDHGSFSTREAALQFVEEWFEEKPEVEKNFREPEVGDIYRVKGLPWMVVSTSPPEEDGLFLTRMEALITEQELSDGFRGDAVLYRKSNWYSKYAEFIGNKSQFLEPARELLGSFFQGERSIPYVIDGFTQREGMTVHYALAESGETYCCFKPYPLPKGNVVTDNTNAVTCPAYRPEDVGVTSSK